MTEIQIFNDDGSPRDIPEAELATLDQEKRTRLAILQRATADDIANTAELTRRTKSTHAAVKNHDAILIERDRAIPRLTHMDLLRRDLWRHE